MATISWNLAIQASGQAPISVSTNPQPVEAIDRVVVTLEPGDSDKLIEIQPGGATAIALMAITSDRYGAAFSFKASDGSSDSAPITLDAPQIYSNGSVALFGLDPMQLKLSNTSSDQTAAVEIFVARDATP